MFRSAVEHRDEYRAMIDSFILDHNSWDPERLALMDIVIMLAAITEIVDFPQIPIPVTLNEYIEIANSYSTPRSGPYGFSQEAYSRADRLLGLSQMTFTHEMVRLFFTEQVYRAMTILRGEPYHHQ